MMAVVSAFNPTVPKMRTSARITVPFTTDARRPVTCNRAPE